MFRKISLSFVFLILLVNVAYAVDLNEIKLKQSSENNIRGNANFRELNPLEELLNNIFAIGLSSTTLDANDPLLVTQIETSWSNIYCKNTYGVVEIYKNNFLVDNDAHSFGISDTINNKVPKVFRFDWQINPPTGGWSEGNYDTVGYLFCDDSPSLICTNNGNSPVCSRARSGDKKIGNVDIDSFNVRPLTIEGCEVGKTQSCGGPNVGICKAGTRTCQSDRTWGSCQNEVKAKSTDTCGNNLDDNCDGTIDETCEDGETPTDGGTQVKGAKLVATVLSTSNTEGVAGKEVPINLLISNIGDTAGRTKFEVGIYTKTWALDNNYINLDTFTLFGRAGANKIQSCGEFREDFVFAGELTKDLQPNEDITFELRPKVPDKDSKFADGKTINWEGIGNKYVVVASTYQSCEAGEVGDNPLQFEVIEQPIDEIIETKGKECNLLTQNCGSGLKCSFNPDNSILSVKGICVDKDVDIRDTGGSGNTGEEVCDEPTGSPCNLISPILGFRGDNTQSSDECASGICVDVEGLEGICGTKNIRADGVKVEPHPTCIAKGTAKAPFDISNFTSYLQENPLIAFGLIALVLILIFGAFKK